MWKKKKWKHRRLMCHSFRFNKLKPAFSFHSPFDLRLRISLHFYIKSDCIIFFCLNFLVQILQDDRWRMNNKLPKGWGLTDLIDSYNLKYSSKRDWHFTLIYLTTEECRRAREGPNHAILGDEGLQQADCNLNKWIRLVTLIEFRDNFGRKSCNIYRTWHK